jgi:acyl-CoA thioesterase-1
VNAASNERTAWDVAERDGLIVPCPLVSRGRPVFASTGAAAGRAGRVFAWSADIDGAGEPPWIAVHAGVGHSRLLVSWASAEGSGSGADSALPSAYRIESSADPTNGRDGAWRLERSVSHNRARARAHVIEFDGQSWVRLTFDAAHGAPSISLRQLDLHDASDGTDDCWLLLGNELGSSTRAQHDDRPGWAELLHEAYPGYYPAVIDETRPGESPSTTLSRLEALLETHPDVRHVALAFGNECLAEGDKESGPSLEALTRALLSTGRLPVFARTPFSKNVPRERVEVFNRAIEEVEARHQLVAGPDLCAWFAAHPEQLGDDRRPTPEGRRAIERLWADALDVFYVPQ